MAPKRKSTTKATEEEPKSKRTTKVSSSTVASTSRLSVSKRPTIKASTSTSKKNTASTAASGSSSKKPTGKARAEVVAISSDEDDDDDSDVIVEPVVPKKKTAAAKKTPEPAKASKSSKTKPSTSSTKKSTSSKPEAKSPEPSTSTSTPPPPSSTVAPGSAKKKQAEHPLTWEQQCRKWFGDFASEDDPEIIDFDGIQKLFEEMNVSLAEVTALVLSYKLDAEKFGSYSYTDWERALRSDSIKSTSELKKWLKTEEADLWSNEPTSTSDKNLHKFYLYLFTYMMPEGQKTLPGDVAITIWELVLAPRFETAKALVAYGQSFEEGKFKGVSRDVYHQTWDFVKSVTPDLEGWSEEDAWPSTIDSFVEWQQEQLKKQE